MKCEACDVILSTKESVRKFKESGTYVDLCDKCLKSILDDFIEVIEPQGIEEDEYE